MDVLTSVSNRGYCSDRGVIAVGVAKMIFGSDMSVGKGGSAAFAAARVLPLPLPTLPLLCSGPAVCARGSELVSV